MLSIKILIPTILTLFISTVQSATIPQVIAANSDLVSQINTADASIVAIDATTPTATKQKVPTTLQTVNLAIVSTQASLTPTAASADPALESQLARSFGRFANAVEEIAAEMIQKKQYLATVPNLQNDAGNQIGYLDDNFRRYVTFTQGCLAEQYWITKVQGISDRTTMLIGDAKNAYA